MSQFLWFLVWAASMAVLVGGYVLIVRRHQRDVREVISRVAASPGAHARYVVGTGWGDFHTDRYEGTVDVFTDRESARTEADALNESAFMTGPDGKVVHANPWKVYELVEVGL